MAAFEKEEFETKARPRVKEIEVSSLGGKVFIRTLTGAQRDEIERLLTIDKGTKTNVRGRVVCYALCDAEGERFYTDAQAGRVAEFSSDVLDEIFTEAMRMSGMMPSAIEELSGN